MVREDSLAVAVWSVLKLAETLPEARAAPTDATEAELLLCCAAAKSHGTVQTQTSRSLLRGGCV